MTTYQIVVKGKVQGVFFRAEARDKAKELNLNGWVRNTLNGDVEIVVEGERERLEEFVTWCRRGPENAKVSAVSIIEIGPIEVDGFMIKR